MFGLFKKKQKQTEYNLVSKTFYSVEVGILDNYFPLVADIHSHMIGVYDNERCYVQYYFDGLMPVAAILWIDDWKSSLSEEDRLEIFTLLDVPATKSAHILAFEVNSFLHNKGYGRAVLKDFVSDKDFVALSAIDGSQGFYKKCGFDVDRLSNYYFYMKNNKPKQWNDLLK
ncbi:MAG: hypothetical protein MJ159_07050 [Treponemataceae bacterium]|nr:hypothetical protein [Treponemataceae bacterium]